MSSVAPNWKECKVQKFTGTQPRDHADDCGRRYKVHEPGEQQGGSDRVPQPCPAHRPRNAHERRHQPHDADDASHGAGAEQVQRIQGSQHHAQQCAPAHAAQQAATGLVTCQGLADEEEGAAGGCERGQTGGMQIHPRHFAPQVLRAQTKQVQRKQQAARDEQCVLDEQHIAQIEPLCQAVDQQTQRQPRENAL